jgi:hypothetical protein
MVQYFFLLCERLLFVQSATCRFETTQAINVFLELNMYFVVFKHIFVKIKENYKEFEDIEGDDKAASRKKLNLLET